MYMFLWIDFCIDCLQCPSSEEILTSHKRVCLEISFKQGVNMPKGGINVQFSNYDKQFETPFVIYADFKSSLIKVHKPNIWCWCKSILLLAMITKL